jgi:hypothetical protein
VGARPFADSAKVGFRERGGRFVGRFQQPSFKFGRDRKGSELLVPYRSHKFINQIARIIAGARANLLLQKILNVFGQGNGHRSNVLEGRGYVNRASFETIKENGPY